MAINPDDLQRLLCDQLCASVRVERRPDGQLMLGAEFEFPDGDRYPIYLSEAPGGVRLSDKGDTLMRISYDHDIDAFLAGSRGLLVERILGEERVGQDRGVFYLDAPTDRLSDALFRYGRALTRIYDLTLHSRSRAASTFYDDLADLLLQTTDEERIQRDHLLPNLPKPGGLPDRLSFGGEGRWPGFPLWRSESGQGPSGHDHPVSLPPHSPGFRFDSGVQRSGRDTSDGPGEALGCGGGHGLVAGVE